MILHSNQNKLFNLDLADLGRFSNRVTQQRGTNFINAYGRFMAAQQNGLPRDIQLLINHNTLTTGPKIWDCPIAGCDKKCKSKQLLVEHGYHSRAHNGVTVPCILCDIREMDQASNYRKHLISVHEYGLNGEPISEMPCQYCGEMLKPGRNGNRIRHMESERCSKIRRAAPDAQFSNHQFASSVGQQIRNINNFNFSNVTTGAQIPQQQAGLVAPQQFENVNNFNFNNPGPVQAMENFSSDDDFDFDQQDFYNDGIPAPATGAESQWADFDTMFQGTGTGTDDDHSAQAYDGASSADPFAWDSYMDVTEVEAGQKAAQERADEQRRRAQEHENDSQAEDAQAAVDFSLLPENEFFNLAAQLELHFQ